MPLVTHVVTDTDTDYGGVGQTAIDAQWKGHSTTAGNTVVIGLAINEYPNNTVTDVGIPDLSAQGYTLRSTSNGTRHKLLEYVKENCSAGESDVTITLPTPDATFGHTIAVILAEFNSMPASGVFDVESNALRDATTDTSLTFAGLTTTQAEETLVGFATTQFQPSGEFVSADAGSDLQMTDLVVEVIDVGSSQQGISIALFVKQVTATGTYDGLFTLDLVRRWSTTLVGLKEATATEINQAISPAIETDNPITLTGTKTKTLAFVIESETSIPITASKTSTILPAVETDTAINVTGIISQSINTVTETDVAAGVISTDTSLEILTVEEIDSAPAVSTLGTINQAISPAIETDVLVALDTTKTQSVNTVIEFDTGVNLLLPISEPIDPAIEVDHAIMPGGLLRPYPMMGSLRIEIFLEPNDLYYPMQGSSKWEIT